MWKKKCNSCSKKIEKKFSYCPHCGYSFKNGIEADDFGMLGREDDFGNIQEELKLPLGMGKLMNSLIKQLEKELGNANFGEPGAMPKGFRIQVSTGKPQMRPVANNQNNPAKKIKVIEEKVSEKEMKRRMTLPKTDAVSRVRRLSDRIIYEIVVPGVGSNKDVVITSLETGLEVKAYSKDKCYVKVIPLTVEVIGYHVEDDKVFIELKA